MAPRAPRPSARSVEKVASPLPAGDDADVGLRRSGRARKRPADLQDEHEDGAATEEGDRPPPAKKPKTPPRRNARRAAAVAQAVYDIPQLDEIHEKAFAPLSPEDLKRWRGWTDFESEPSFFSRILCELGVKDAKIQEMLSLDESAFDVLPKPIYGLIFLYRFHEDCTPDREDCPPHVWFANQTTANACATVAILNIAMNCEDLSLGDKLAKFKTTTQKLHPALRGHLLSTNDDIRAVHNSFARRTDILNSDLALKNQFDEVAERKKVAARGRGRRPKKKTDEDDSVFHYIAYVPIEDRVWELDGMHEQPLCIGTFDGDWVAAALARIAERIKASEVEDGDGGAFNLLTFCHSPSNGLREALASNIHHLLILDQNQVAKGSEWTDLTGQQRVWMDGSDKARLEAYHLTSDDIYRAPVPQGFVDRVAKASFGVSEAMDLLQQLQDEQDRIRSEYENELDVNSADVARVAGRRKDYTPVIHAWVKKLAERGFLRGLHSDTQ